MRITKRITQEVEVTDDIICNRCGESCVLHDYGDGKSFGGLCEAAVSGCYDSRVLPDDMEFTFSLCEKCLGELFSAFKIQPSHNGDCIGFRVEGEWVDGRFCMRERERPEPDSEACNDCTEGDCVRCRP